MKKISDYDFVYQDEDYFYLYKHQPISDSRLKVLTEGTISFTKPDKFNDPFDCTFDIDDGYNHTMSELRELHIKYGCEPQSPAKRLQANQKFKNHQKQALNDGSFFKKVHSQTGVCCLNHNPLEILMWSHYADEHRGFLIELRFPKKSHLFESHLKGFIPIPVVYSDEMPVLTQDDKLGSDDVETAKKIYLTKSSSWEYEKEFRVVANNLY